MVASTAVQCQPLHAYWEPISLRDLQHTCASLCVLSLIPTRAEGRSPRETYLANPDHGPKGGKLEQLKPETQRASGISYPTSAWCRRVWHFVAHLPLPAADSSGILEANCWEPGQCPLAVPEETWAVE